MEIIVDKGAGFCPGVQKTIQKAEELLTGEKRVLALGELIHNRVELERLDSLGLKTIEHSQLNTNAVEEDAVVLFRAHGEPPSTYAQLEARGLNYLDGTCSIVKRSQKIAAEFARKGYQVVIVGKKSHPESIGIAGYCQPSGIIIASPEEVSGLNRELKYFVLAQTTIPETQFEAVLEEMRQHRLNFEYKNTVCRFVKNRHKEVQQLARQCDVLIMVGGRNSSNTKMLFQHCREANPHSYWIENAGELQRVWFNGANKVGITGGASTPAWLLQEVGEKIRQINTQ